MDGRLYPIGTEIDTEGRHTLQVNAIDAAGNEAVARAEFVIDHTPPKIQFYQVEEGAQYEGILNFQVRIPEKRRLDRRSVEVNGKRTDIKKRRREVYISDYKSRRICSKRDSSGSGRE